MSGRDIFAEFRKALSATGQAPCDRFGCDRRKQCSEQKLACESFAHYVATGACMSPTAEGIGLTVKRKAAQHTGPNPSREWFAVATNN